MNYRVIIILSLCALFLVGSVDAWYDFHYTYRQEFTITNLGANLTNNQSIFTIYRSSGTSSNFNVYVGSKCEIDYDDIRFVGSDDATAWSYWIEDGYSSSSANIIVKIPSIPNSTTYGTTTGYLYYGYSSASAASNINNALIFGDSFDEEVLNTTKWSISVIGSPSYSQSGGAYHYSGSATSQNIVLKALYGATSKNTITEVRASFDSYTEVGESVLRTGADATYQNTLGDGSTAGTMVRRTPLHEGVEWGSTAEQSLAYGTPYILGSRYDPDLDIYYHNRDRGSWTEWASRTTNPSSLYAKVSPNNYCAVTIYYVIVRSHAAIAPTISAWESEEERPATVTAIISSASPPSGTGYAPLLVSWFDGSTSVNCTVDYWNWSFGDGSYSNSQNPQHEYLSSGTFTYDLTVGNTTYYIYNTASDCGIGPLGICLSNYEVLVNTDVPNADFSVTETCGSIGDTFYFIDFSTGGGLYAWNWSFGDGTANSTLRNPTHQYAANGTYDVTLTVTGAYGSDTLLRENLITIPCGAATPTPTPTVTPSPDPHADFTANTTIICYPGYPVPIQFTSTSTGTAPLTYDWDIDGDYYDVATFVRTFDIGTYTISLNVSNALGYDEEIKTNYITVLNCTGGGGNGTTTIISSGGGGQVIYPANLMGSPGLMVLLSLGFVGVGGIVVLAFAIGRRRDM